MALPSIEIQVEVPFHDVDAMAVVWHGHYLKYLELARCALLRSFAYDYPEMRASGYVWPIVECQLKYLRPARYGQRLRLRATLIEYENRLRIDYLLLDATNGERICKAQSTQVAVHLESGEMSLVSPPVLFERLGVPVPQ
ncbi:MAG: acyl-CoA thioesterase [Betaproteobacteria bacterium]|nr:acyl-CoA thioesterase [Betaproteobacteria bacterium]